MEPGLAHRFGRIRVYPIALQSALMELPSGPTQDSCEREAEEVAALSMQPAQEKPENETSQGLGPDFSRVRIHTDDQANKSARAVNARAYTVGHHIVFAQGQFEPASSNGKQLIAHELTHVVQQQGQQVSAEAGAGVSTPGQKNPLQRAISAELEEIEDKLSYGIFDWAITEAEAVKSLAMLRELPKYQQATFFAGDKFPARLREHLPTARQTELDALEASVSGMVPPKSELEEIQSNLSYGIFDWAITDQEAINSLERLKKLPDEQLAVALGAIDYDRLMDNLPADRKQELTNLVARSASKTGGVSGSVPSSSGGAVLNAITFRSDHGLMQDNAADWGASGKLLGEPEWFVKDGVEVSRPISQTKGTAIEVQLNLNILPATSAEEPISIQGRSDIGLLDFDYSGNIQGGLNRRITLRSTKTLPDNIAAFPNERIVWTITFHNATQTIAPTAGHTVFVTMAKPRQFEGTVANRGDEEITVRRMATAVKIISELETLEPHAILRGIMQNWNKYSLEVPMRPNIWTFADEIGVGGQCIDIVRFVTALINTVGCPGKAQPVVVWAHPDNPSKAIEQEYKGAVGLHTVPAHPRHPDWGAALLDGGWKSNAYEAALKFDYGGTLAYYPGGVDGVLTDKQEVLEVFKCLAWVRGTGGLNCRIAEVLADYPNGPCPIGSEHECFIPRR
jgi:hypothetical protein